MTREVENGKVAFKGGQCERMLSPHRVHDPRIRVSLSDSSILTSIRLDLFPIRCLVKLIDRVINYFVHKKRRKCVARPRKAILLRRIPKKSIDRTVCVDCG